MGSRLRTEVWSDTLPGVRAINARQPSAAAELNRIAAGADQSLSSVVGQVQAWTSTAWRLVIGRNGKVARKGPAAG